jgi:hypothetical protein
MAIGTTFFPAMPFIEEGEGVNLEQRGAINTLVVGLNADVLDAVQVVGGSTAAGRAMLTAADAAEQRATLELGTLAIQNGTFSNELAAIAGLTSAADKLPYFTGSETAALADFTAAGRALLDDANAAAQRATLNAAGAYETRAAFVSAVSGGLVHSNGITTFAGGIAYKWQSGATAISDLAGLVPVEPISILHFGAVGDGVADDSAAINAALAGGNNTVYFPSGNYLVQSYLRVYANTVIEMDVECTILNDNLTSEYVFVNGERGNTSYATGYDGEGNITIRGGTIDNALRAARSQNTNPISFGHADGVLIENVRFLNNYSSHSIEINSSRNVRIRDCLFSGLTAPSPASREFINIDYSFAIGFPTFGAYDNTVCRDVVVEGCTFLDGDVGVGSHSAPAGADPDHIGIIVRDCYFENMTSAGITPQFWDGSLVTGNTLVSCGARVIRGWGITRSTISDNTIIGGGSSFGITIDDASSRIPKDIIISGNRLIGTASTSIYVADSLRVKVLGNLITAAGSEAILIDDTSSFGEVGGNTVLGANQINASKHAVDIEASDCIVSDNIVSNDGLATQYVYGIKIESTAPRCLLGRNIVEAGSTGKVDLGPAVSHNTNQIIEVTDNTNAALRVTQLGTGNALLIEDSANPDSTPIVVDNSGRFIVGHTSTVATNGTAGVSAQVVGTSYATTGFAQARFANSNAAANHRFAKSRGATVNTYAIVQNNDDLGQIVWEGDDGTGFVEAASIKAAVDSTPGVGDMPGRLSFWTSPDGSAAVVERLRVDSAGNILNRSTGGLGYGTGSGGTVTQSGSRTTGVTLDKTNGAITMFSAAGSTTAATFTVTNSTVAATDTIIVNQKSGTNLYDLMVTAVAAGSFNITFRTTGGTATDAPVINFAVLKAVTS